VLRRDFCAERDSAAVRALFAATFCLGRPAEFALPDGYVDLCLGWYLGPGAGDAAVIENDGEVVGYALVCGDPAAHHRWARRTSAALAVQLVPRCLRPEAADLRHFATARLRDLRAVRSTTRRPPMPVHAHLNVASPHRSGSAAVLLRDHIDERALMANAPGWFAEVNAIRGRRFQALERVLGPVTERRPNHTLTWLSGRPVERLTVVRPLP